MRVAGLRLGVALALLVTASGCGLLDERPRYAYRPAQFREEVRLRLPELPPGEPRVPFEIDAASLRLARNTIRTAPIGHARVEALVRMLHRDPPDGLGLRYSATTTSRDAMETLRIGRGNCVALASVLVGLGRGLGWPVYYAEALVPDEEILTEEDLAIRADHMVVLITAKTVQAVVDFTGPVEGYRFKVIDDIHAYAHLINNRASEQILLEMAAGQPPDWERALEGFSLAARLMPDMARAWNNQGVALARLGRIEEARSAYARALGADAELGSTHQNLVVLETRARGETSISKAPAGR